MQLRLTWDKNAKSIILENTETTIHMSNVEALKIETVDPESQGFLISKGELDTLKRMIAYFDKQVNDNKIKLSEIGSQHLTSLKNTFKE